MFGSVMSRPATMENEIVQTLLVPDENSKFMVSEESKKTERYQFFLTLLVCLLEHESLSMTASWRVNSVKKSTT